MVATSSEAMCLMSTGEIEDLYITVLSLMWNYSDQTMFRRKILPFHCSLKKSTPIHYLIILPGLRSEKKCKFPHQRNFWVMVAIGEFLCSKSFVHLNLNLLQLIYNLSDMGGVS